ncbi:MAG: Gfo/Idh/MocA family oxidoreductase [Candidatus Alcyoniella australis]|nr:Gfo/Idh/MocA family oxidoreductase [Candidatus Alcyoniella australis]
MGKFRVAQVGSGFISGVHNRALAAIPDVEVVAHCDIDAKLGKRFCKQHKIPDFYTDFGEMIKRPDIEMVTLGVPNYLHAQYTLAAAKAGKHVVCEKPLALTLADADKMIAACKKAGVVLGYAEELCYAPKFVHAKDLVDKGAIGEPFFVKQAEKHGGPYSPWFWQEDLAGGGILMDMGCHSIEFCRWMLGKPKVKSVYAQIDLYVHKKVTKQDDHVLMIIEFQTGQTALVESSWTLQGGMISVAEVHGPQGVVHANLLQDGMGLKVYSEKGYAPERKETRGWHCPDWEWAFNNGYPGEMRDFVDCARNGGTPVETGEDGRVVLEIMIAGYLSAAQGRKIEFPFKPPRGFKTPVQIWIDANKKKK